MNKILKYKIYVIVLIYLLCSSYVYADIKFIENFRAKGNKIYKSYKDTLYILNKNELYEYRNKCLVKFFTNDNGINDIVFNGNFIVIFNINEIFVLNEYTKDILWTKQFIGKIIGKPILTNFHVILDKNSTKLVSFDVNTGLISWKFYLDIPNFSFGTNSVLLYNQHHLVYVYANRKVIILNKKSGKHLKTYGLNKRKISGVHEHDFYIVKALLYNDILYLCYDNGSITLFDLRCGAFIVNNFDSKYKDFLVYKNQIVFFNGSNIISHDKFNGKILWQFECDKFYNYLLLTKKKILLLYNDLGELYFINIDNGKLIKYTILKKYIIKKILVNNEEDTIWVFSNKDNISVFNIDFL